MRVFASAKHGLHDPERELESSAFQTPFESPRRAEVIRAALEADGGFDVVEPTEWGTAAIIGAVVGGAAGAIIGSQMDKQAKELEQTVNGATVERVGEGIQVTFASGLLFDFDSDVVRSEARANLRELALSLSQHPGSELLILGHTDQLGSTTYNQDLSERRAGSAGSYLMSQGVAGSRIATRGLGESEAVATNDTEAGRQANRRVEVAIYASKEARANAARQGQ